MRADERPIASPQEPMVDHEELRAELAGSLDARLCGVHGERDPRHGRVLGASRELQAVNCIRIIGDRAEVQLLIQEPGDLLEGRHGAGWYRIACYSCEDGM